MRWVLVAALVGGAGPATSYTAPPGWFINGVRENGRYEALPVLGLPKADLDDARARREIRDDRRIVGWIWCWRPATPRQDGTRVWCEP